ncbi:MAG: PAS domain S-box protein, partial [candidate division Zixibacteria bacterium]|nr:PAS domain S-box protein [candidate division Zixibacteria bacterium]
MDNIHNLLKQQLEHRFGGLSSYPQEWESFLEAVNSAYKQFDADRNMLERSLDLSSQELLQANSDMMAVFQAFSDIFFRLNSEGKIIDFRAGHTADLFLEPEKLIGKRIIDIPDEDVGNIFQEAILQVQETKSIVRIEYSVKIKKEEHYYEARLIPLLENQIIVIIREITKRKSAELALQESEKRFRDIAENMADWIWEVDENGVYTYCSETINDILGYHAD